MARHIPNPGKHPDRPRGDRDQGEPMGVRTDASGSRSGKQPFDHGQGDAQIDNWESWKAVSFSLPDGAGPTRTVTSKDLLERTVFYKVGHHGSHNATHRAEGLELMTSPDLVAMIPVNHQTAKKKKWNMPFPPLLKRLTEKCRSRVIRQDEPTGTAVVAAATALPKNEAERFKKRVDETELCVECGFPL